MEFNFNSYRPGNIFIYGNNNLKIGDFGLATHTGDFSPTKNQNETLSFHPDFDQNTNIGNKSVKLKDNVGTPLYQSNFKK